MKVEHTHYLELTDKQVKELYTFCHLAKANGDNRAEKYMKILEKIIKNED